MSWLPWLQWPAMIVTVIAAWFTGSTSEWRRKWGFWMFLASNVLWMLWGYSAHAWAVVLLQVLLGIVNIRGARKNQAAS
jgi:hypothetical protein